MNYDVEGHLRIIPWLETVASILIRGVSRVGFGYQHPYFLEKLILTISILMDRYPKIVMILHPEYTPDQGRSQGMVLRCLNV